MSHSLTNPNPKREDEREAIAELLHDERGEKTRKHDYWVIVGLTPEGEWGNRSARVIDRSQDCKDRDVCVEILTEDDGDRLLWTKDRPAGLYKLQVHPYGDGGSYDLNVVSAELLYPLSASARPSPGDPVRAALEEACEPWSFHIGDPPEDDSPLSGVFGAGITYTEQHLAELLGVVNFERGDGSEDFRTDAGNTLLNILAAAGLYDKDEDRFAALSVSTPTGEGEASADQIELAAKAIYDRQRALLPDQEGVNAQRPWRTNDVPDIFWNGYYSDAEACLNSLRGNKSEKLLFGPNEAENHIRNLESTGRNLDNNGICRKSIDAGISAIRALAHPQQGGERDTSDNDEAEIARVMAMSDDEVLAEGGDPEQASLFVNAAFDRAKIIAENRRLRNALERARSVLGNMALEHETGWRSIFARWPIHHEPLRSDARHLLPVIDVALFGAIPSQKPGPYVADERGTPITGLSWCAAQPHEKSTSHCPACGVGPNEACRGRVPQDDGAKS